MDEPKRFADCDEDRKAIADLTARGLKITTEGWTDKERLYLIKLLHFCPKCGKEYGEDRKCWACYYDPLPG